MPKYEARFKELGLMLLTLGYPVILQQVTRLTARTYEHRSSEVDIASSPKKNKGEHFPFLSDSSWHAADTLACCVGT